MTDAESIQLLASLNSRALRTIENLSSSGPQHHPQFRPPQQHQQFPPSNFQPQQQDYQVPQIPDYLPSTMPTNLVEFPKDAQGNPIVPPEYRHLIPNQPPNINQPAAPVNYSNAAFDVPNYSTTPAVPDESKFDIIIKEIKSLKKAINKLIKLNETAKLPEDKPLIGTVNDTENKPS